MAANSPASSASSLPEQVLSHAQSGREVVQDFVPLADSLEWDLGQQYLRDRGNKAFISDASPVPFVINNDGTLSRNAAEVFFASLVAAEKNGTLEDEIFVLELGIGVGLFARFFLDHFKELCVKNRKGFYDRLCYVAADRSQRMLLDVLRHGVLGNHPGRYCVRNVDAMNPDAELPHDVRFRHIKGKPFRAVFLNYLLDCLPAAVLEIDEDRVKQLCVRTCIARNVTLSAHTDMSLKQLQARAKANDSRSRQELLEVYGLFASEYDYRPVEIKKVPLGDFALEYSRRMSKRVLHSYGAIQSLEKLLDLVTDDGFILVNDYGPTQTTRDDEFEHQRFSLATFVGVNFPLLKAYFGDQGKCQFVHPTGSDSRGIHTRLLGRKLDTDTVTRFYACFSDAAHEQVLEPIGKARMCLRAGRFELAADFYQQALKLQPRNWLLLNEVSSFLTFSMRDLKAAIDMAKLALGLNPTCSAELWNTLGDALFEFGRTAEARGAYQKAMAVNNSDVRSRYNLAWVLAREGDHAAALRHIADALALDKTGEYRDRLLQKHSEVVARLAMRHQTEYFLLINLVSKYAKPDDKKPNDAAPPDPQRTPEPPVESWG